MVVVHLVAAAVDLFVVVLVGVALVVLVLPPQKKGEESC